MQIELIQYAPETTPSGFEAHISVQEIKDAEEWVRGRVHVGRVKIFDEETGKYTWFCVEAKRNGNKAPVLEITNIRPNQDKITNCVGRYRQAEKAEV